jgi:hypothetical protein
MTPPNATVMARPSSVRYQGLAFAIVTAILAGAAFAPTLSLLGIGSLLALAVAGYFIFQLVDGNADLIVLLWVGLSPLGYYFLTFPREGGIFTFDRTAILMLAAAIVLCPRGQRTAIPDDLRKTALVWIIFLVAALLSVVNVGDIRLSVRMWLEVFVFPAILGWYVIACFPVRKYLRLMHGLACVAAIYSAAIGVAEVYLGRDLLPLPGAGETFAGGQDVLILRVNGPYSSNNSYGLIGLVSFCLIWFLRSAIADRMPGWQKLLNVIGITAALTAAMLPLFRSIALTIACILVVDLFRRLTVGQRALRLSVLALMGAGVLAVMISVPELFEERVSQSGNIYARMAQQKQNLQLFVDHPVLGVGLNNFHVAATTSAAARLSYDSTPALDYPHSNVGAVLAETGLVGFVPFAMSQVLLVMAFWKLRRSALPGRKLSWIFFGYVFLSYWISGLALTSGYYSDLNLWYIFCLAVIYKYGITDELRNGAPSALDGLKAGD